MTLLAPRDVARRLQLSTSRVVQLDREGKLIALRYSAGRRLYEPDVVERFARERALASSVTETAAQHKRTVS
jgi:DNA-binding transcriptional MerR regulator